MDPNRKAENTFEWETQFIYQWFFYHLEQSGNPEDRAAALKLLKRIDEDLVKNGLHTRQDIP